MSGHCTNSLKNGSNLFHVKPFIYISIQCLKISKRFSIFGHTLWSTPSPKTQKKLKHSHPGGEKSICWSKSSLRSLLCQKYSAQELSIGQQQISIKTDDLSCKKCQTDYLFAVSTCLLQGFCNTMQVDKKLMSISNPVHFFFAIGKPAHYYELVFPFETNVISLVQILILK